MTLSYMLAPIPKWVIMNKAGTVAGGAKLYTYRSLNKTEKKTVYQDPGGTIPWTNPIIFDLNGTQGPFYWTVDSNDLEDTYYLEAYDRDNTLLWTIDNYFPPGDGGGGGTVTSFIPIVNYITNNQFIDHIDDITGSIGPSLSLPTNLLIAPSNHRGFTPTQGNPLVGTYGVLGPDIRFVKNNTNASDNISFPVFALASYPLTGDVTPVDYVRYQCTNSPAGETYKCFQFPITQKVKNLSNTAMTFGMWAAVAATPVDLNVYIRQYYGSGTAATAESGATRTLAANFTLSTTWTWYPFTISIPSAAGGSLGTPGQQTNDDALYIQIEMPLGSPCDVFFIKPALFLGNIDPELEFDSYDQIDSIDQTPRTGDLKVSYFDTAPSGWVIMDDNSIGNVGSGATNRANQDTFQLYKTLWDNVSDTWAPVSTGRGASAIADFIAGKTLTLPRALGRALASSGAGSGLTSRALGEFLGNENVTLAAANMPPQVGVCSTLNGGNIAVQGGVTFNAFGTTTGNGNFAQGADSPFSIMQPTSFMHVFIKL